MSHRLLPIFGGTFDPVHNGHLQCALEVAEWLEEPVALLPSHRPAHRNQPGATADQRLEMLSEAVRDCPLLTVDDRELRRPGPTYTVDTLSEWRGEAPEAAFCFIVGQDAFAGLHTWHRWRDLRDLTHFIVITRPGPRPELHDELRRWLTRATARDLAALAATQAGQVIFRAVTPLEISASAIRERIAAGGDPGFLVPTAVRRLIRDSGLYRR
ncbi:MAG: nicotinate-nucleotide adenylyltransferase [Xanthomonadales bacterium]|nr:nicotinate-nucleotide adenylyltransferase [Xanthomonadales bacterium]